MSNYKFEKILSLYKSTLTANPDLELYRNNTKIPLHTPDAKLLKCIDWISTIDTEMIALGYSSGRVLLGQIIQEKLQFISEFLPRHSRTCIDVAFCPVNAKLLATALDKVRNDCGLNVWDIERCASGDDFSITSMHGSNASISSKSNEKPLASYGSSEGISSMAWFNDSTRIVAGMSQKWIRLFDLRGILNNKLRNRHDVIFIDILYKSSSGNYYRSFFLKSLGFVFR